jgi:hypothetical protein
MENQLVTIIKESQLEQTKAQYILDNFQDYFKIASEWEIKASTIHVTNADQKTEMKMAREARLFLREKRIDVEKARKTLKEQSLREGKAIDGIANVLKALIEPIEQYLDKQEHFVEIQQAEEDARLKAEEEIKAEQERIAKEKADAEERQRISLENEQLKKEAEEREKAEKEKRELERQIQVQKEDKERMEQEALVKKENEEKEKVELEKTKAYQSFLSKNGYNETTKVDFYIEQKGEKVVLYKKIAEFTK